jgi:SWI/SNF-related matrix-associated actin-dependent regulator 1 of chromatin subfamily A
VAGDAAAAEVAADQAAAIAAFARCAPAAMGEAVVAVSPGCVDSSAGIGPAVVEALIAVAPVAGADACIAASLAARPKGLASAGRPMTRVATGSAETGAPVALAVAETAVAAVASAVRRAGSAGWESFPDCIESVADSADAGEDACAVEAGPGGTEAADVAEPAAAGVGVAAAAEVAVGAAATGAPLIAPTAAAESSALESESPEPPADLAPASA